MALRDADGLLFMEYHLEVYIEARPERVYQAFVFEHERWWPHHFTEHGRYHLEPWVGGRILEEWGDGTGALVGLVTCLKPNETIMLAGVPSPLGFSTARVTIRLEPEGTGTRLKYKSENLGEFTEQTDAVFDQGTRTIYDKVFREYCEREPTPA